MRYTSNALGGWARICFEFYSISWGKKGTAGLESLHTLSEVQNWLTEGQKVTAERAFWVNLEKSWGIDSGYVRPSVGGILRLKWMSWILLRRQPESPCALGRRCKTLIGANQMWQTQEPFLKKSCLPQFTEEMVVSKMGHSLHPSVYFSALHRFPLSWAVFVNVSGTGQKSTWSDWWRTMR